MLKFKLPRVIVFVALIILISCFEPPPENHLSVPFYKQIDPYSCGAACVQMWARYLGINVTQRSIINYMGIQGSSPTLIADAASFICSKWIIPSCFAGGNESQNHSIADQLYSIRCNEPCIAIVSGGWHAIILIGAAWHEEPDGTPYMDQVWVHDPDYYLPFPNYQYSIAQWKMHYESCMEGECYCTVIEGPYASNPEAKAGYNEFRARGGTYYGETQTRRSNYLIY